MSRIPFRRVVRTAAATPSPVSVAPVGLPPVGMTYSARGRGTPACCADVPSPFHACMTCSRASGIRPAPSVSTGIRRQPSGISAASDPLARPRGARSRRVAVGAAPCKADLYVGDSTSRLLCASPASISKALQRPSWPECSGAPVHATILPARRTPRGRPDCRWSRRARATPRAAAVMLGQLQRPERLDERGQAARHGVLQGVAQGVAVDDDMRALRRRLAPSPPPSSSPAAWLRRRGGGLSVTSSDSNGNGPRWACAAEGDHARMASSG